MNKNEKIQKFLLALKIVQVVDNKERNRKGLKRLGKGYFKAYRLNPYNPLSYLLILVALPILIIWFGISGGISNPFKWE